MLFNESFSKTIEHSERKRGVEDQVEEEFKTSFHGFGVLESSIGNIMPRTKNGHWGQKLHFNNRHIPSLRVLIPNSHNDQAE